MEKVIYFDMDGTLANLYAVKNWEPQLRAHNPRPYAIAKTLINMQVLARLLNSLKKRGYYIGIISWLARGSIEEYDKAVTQAKMQWINKHLKSVTFDEIKIVEYGKPKSTIATRPRGILFDDELKNRNEWRGIAYDEKNIIRILKNLLKTA